MNRSLLVLAFAFLASNAALAADAVTCKVGFKAANGDSVMQSFMLMNAGSQLDSKIELADQVQQGISDKEAYLQLEQPRSPDADPTVVTGVGKGSKGLRVYYTVLALSKATRADLYQGPEGATQLLVTLTAGKAATQLTANVPDGGTIEATAFLDGPGHLGGLIPQKKYKITAVTLSCKVLAPAAPVAQPVAEAEESIRLPKQLTKAQVEAATRDLARTLSTKHPLN